MVHLHTGHGQGDFTASAFIVRDTPGGLVGLVHLHKKLGTLLQVGGHIEWDETPWSGLAHEVAEETGYRLDELDVLQPYAPLPGSEGPRKLPVPASVESHWVIDGHFHNDLRWAFVASGVPIRPAADGESSDLRWYTLAEMQLDPLLPAPLAADYQLVMTTLWTSWKRYRASTWPTTLPHPKAAAAPA